MKRRSWLLALLIVFVVGGVLLWLASADVQLLSYPNRIGVIEVKGVIDEVREELEDLVEFRRDPNVKAIILRVESPGGAVGPSQELYREVTRTRQIKPVIASLGAVAASGGYYIAAGSSRIFANPGTVTGSIGVIIYYPNLQGLFDKIGYSMIAIKSGQFKDIGNPDREMTAEEKALLQGTIDEVHRQFVQAVAQGRGLPEDTVRAIADGRILTGESARGLGLIDELGNFQDAVSSAALLGKIEGEPKLIYARKEGFSLLGFLLGDELGSQVRNFRTRFSCVRYQAPFAR